MHNIYVSYSVPFIGNRTHKYPLCSDCDTDLRTEAEDKDDEADVVEADGADYLIKRMMELM